MTTSGEPDDALIGEIEGTGAEVFANDQRARRQDMINFAVAFFNEALRAEGRESEMITPRELAERSRDLLSSDPTTMARTVEYLGEEGAQRLLAEMQEPLYEPEDGETL
jgi:hypothetical protein